MSSGLKKSMMLLTLALASMEGGEGKTMSSYKRRPLTDEEKAEMERANREKENQRKLKQGLKLFEIDNIKIYALNEKSAKKKYNKLNKTNHGNR